MWPWEHVAAAYLLYSLGSRATGRGPPSAAAAAAAAGGGLLPDLVDKPLSWGLGAVATGFGPAHSVLVAVPAAAAAVALARRAGRPEVGVAAAVGYLSHLAGDVLNPLRSGEAVDAGRVLWPLVARDPYVRDYGLARGAVYLRGLLAELRATPPAEAVLLYLAVPGVAVAVWLADGAPGTGWIRSLVGGGRRR